MRLGEVVVDLDALQNGRVHSLDSPHGPLSVSDLLVHPFRLDPMTRLNGEASQSWRHKQRTVRRS